MPTCGEFNEFFRTFLQSKIKKESVTFSLKNIFLKKIRETWQDKNKMQVGMEENGILMAHSLQFRMRRDLSLSHFGSSIKDLEFYFGFRFYI